MSLPLWSADGVFFARLHDDIVLLDVPGDRYACLLGAAAWLTPAPDGGLEVAGDAAAAALVEAGLAVRGASGAPRKPPAPARRELSTPRPARPSGVLGAGLSLALSTRAFRDAPLERLLRRSRPAPPARPPDEARLAAVVADWRAALPWVPGEGECLQRAYQLRRLLSRRGLAADWVFGVRTWPFGAHCWIQVGDLVIGDRLDRVRGYTPIMVA